MPLVRTPKQSSSPETDWGSVLRLAESCDYEEEHAWHVTRLALRLFDELRPMHELEEDARLDMQAGALLHDIGVIDGRRNHHKSSLDRIVDSELLPFDQTRRLIIGSIARYHRAALPSKRHWHYAALSPADRQRVCALGGIVRLADCLDRGHDGLVHDLAAAADPERIVVLCQVRQPLDLDPDRAADKAQLLEQTFARRVVLRFQHK